MADLYQNTSGGADSLCEIYQPITPSDTVDLPYVSRAIYAGGYGDITVVTKTGETVTFKDFPQGMFLPVRAVRVKATGTTSTYLVNMV